MLDKRLSAIFEDYDLEIQQTLKAVLTVEQQYITDPLITNSKALKEIRQKINEIIERVCKDEA